MSTEFSNFILFIEFIVLIAIFIPTMVAFITGAPWVPTPNERVKKMLKLAKLKRNSVFYDLGCGDGRMVHLAAKLYGARASGFELSPLVYAWAKIRNFFLKSKSKVFLRDFRNIDVSGADALAFYLLPNILLKMRPKFEKELPAGAVVVSYAFPITGWTPSRVESRNEKKNFGRIYVYKMPQKTQSKAINAPGTAAIK